MIEENWYVFYTKPRSEEKAFNELSHKYEEVFLPKKTEIRQWKDRKKRLKVPLFPSYLFLRIKANQIHYVQSTYYVVKAIKFGTNYATLKDSDITNVKKMIAYDNPIAVDNGFMSGDPVEVIEGPLMGMKGVLSNKRNQFRFALNLVDIHQSLTVDIEVKCLQKLDCQPA